MNKRKHLLVLFSGGVHSSLAVVLNIHKYERITCLTFKRFGIFGVDELEKSFQRLQKRFPKIKFESVILPADGLYKTLLKNEHSIFSLSICGLCKLAMHWRTILYCIDNCIDEVCDGTESSMKQYPDQNEDIALGNLRQLYASLGIHYTTPVFSIGEEAEEALYQLGVTSRKRIRGTADDHQIICTQQRIFKLFVEYYVATNGWERYVSDSRGFFQKKIGYVKTCIDKYRQNVLE